MLATRDIVRGAAAIVGLGLVVALLASALPEPTPERAVRAFAFFCLSVPPLVLAFPAWLRAARAGATRHATGRWIFAALLVGALAPDRLIRGSAVELVGPALYALAALLLTADRPRVSAPLFRDLPLVLLLWLPLELKWLGGEGTLLRLFGLDVLFLLYVVERPLCEPGRLVPSRGRELGWGLGAWAVFLAVAIPSAMATGFARPGLSERPWGEWVLFVVLTFWVVALPEEALFRGAIQGLLERTLRSRWVALALAAVIFGLSHLNNRNGDPPDWRYVVLATVAGVAYGLAYQRTGNLAAPTLTHFLVDVTWRGFFAGQR